MWLSGRKLERERPSTLIKNPPSNTPFKYKDIPKRSSFFFPSEFMLHKDFAVCDSAF